MQPKSDPFRAFQFRRNRSYSTSLRLALRFGVWWAPTTFYSAIRRPMIGFLEGLGMLVMSAVMAGLSVAAWILVSLAIVASGLVGCLVPADDNQN